MARMEKSVMITLIIVVGAIIVAAIIASIITTSSEETINVRGDAAIDVTPDLVKVYLTAETRDSSSQAAKDANSEIVEEVKLALTRVGISQADIKTSNFNIYPEQTYSGGVSRVTGYRATHSLIVELSSNQTDLIGAVLDAGVDAGANIARINFELSPALENLHKAEATKLAAEDAKSKAQALADGLGKKLGPISSVSDSSFNYQPWPLFETASDAGSSNEGIVMEAKKATTNIQPGEQKVFATVQARFKIK